MDGILPVLNQSSLMEVAAPAWNILAYVYI